MIRGYDEWVYLNTQDAAADALRVEELAADALKQPRTAVAAVRTRLADAGLLDAAGSLTSLGHGQLSHGRELVSRATQKLTDGIDPLALQTTIDTLNIVLRRAEQQLNG